MKKEKEWLPLFKSKEQGNGLFTHIPYGHIAHWSIAGLGWLSISLRFVDLQTLSQLLSDPSATSQCTNDILQAEGSVILFICAKLLHYHLPLAFRAPYNHCGILIRMKFYYAWGGIYESKGIDRGSLRIHMGGYATWPFILVTVEKSIGSKETTEYSVSLTPIKSWENHDWCIGFVR